MLRKLIVGNMSNSDGELADVMRELNIRLSHLGVAGTRLRGPTAKGRELSIYGPYIGRAYIETAMTALIARMDPFRVLAAKRHQDADYYEERLRSKSAIQWTGDVLSSTKPSAHFWEMDSHESGFRSILGPWIEELVWKPAFDRFCDAVAIAGPLDEWVTDLASKPPESFCKELRSGLDGHFSKFSKGVHSELLGTRVSMFDAVSLEADFRLAARRITGIALLSHFSEYFLFRLDASRAIHLANRIGKFWK